MAVQDKYITLGGHRHRFIEKGSSEHTMLLVHGISSSLDFYEQVIPHLSRSFRVIAFDLLGFGLSEKPRGKVYSLELYASLIREFLIKTGSLDDKLSAIGHSMGGKYLIASELIDPGTYSSLVLSNTDGFIHVPFFARGISLPGVRRVLKKIITSENVSEKMFASAFHDTKKVNEDSYKKNLGIARDPEAFDTVMALNRNLPKLDLNRTGLRRRIGEIKVPVLVIWGDNDRFFSPSVAESVRNEIPLSTLVMFEECGHAPMLEYPEKFTRTVTDFILSDPYSRRDHADNL
ncbi:MAG: alpha/beta hydrolase [Chlorobiaceae bacterium]|nr:alpha/beta hydrolase [Chlorobiaceae bacterium]NTV60912.1 alpha/beta hydrolase [Chlorobiaceae bacterium]